jgi:cell division septation protein DedD
MRSVVEREEETDSEITLNATTLLGIFFGLVLVCGVFFGFGYSMGRRGTEAPAASTPAANASDNSPAPAATHAPKPSAMESLQTADSSSSSTNSNTVSEPLDADSTSTSSSTQPTAPAAPAVTASASATKPTPASVRPVLKPVSLPTAPASAPVPPAYGGAPVMVQIAAVSHQEDANVLVSALRQRGYSVSVRNESQDKLLHVQVGPFATRDTAKAMRSKLLADGYNAILKP